MVQTHELAIAFSWSVFVTGRNIIVYLPIQADFLPLVDHLPIHTQEDLDVGLVHGVQLFLPFQNKAINMISTTCPTVSIIFEDVRSWSQRDSHLSGPEPSGTDLQHSSRPLVGRDELARVDGPEINVAIVSGRGQISTIAADVNLRDLEK